MNLGQLSEENENFLKQYKSLGYSTKTQMANEAITMLRRHKAKEARKKRLEMAFKELKSASGSPDVVFEELDGENFA